MSDLKYWLGFNVVKGIGAAKTRALVDHFGSVETAWRADRSDLRALGIDGRTINSFIKTRSEIDLDDEMAKLERSNVRLLCWDSAEYPTALRNIPGSPPSIYVKGELTERDDWSIAIVGTRRVTAYGKQMSAEIARALVANGITIVSGLARGVDSIAHEIAVDNGGRTIGVLGSGIDSIYPPENRRLAERIANGQGAVISEYAPGVKPEAKNFPPRNRIISALSLGTVVIEAGKRSGALITAKFAREQGREVYAVPGNVTNPSCEGSNRLIQSGARLLMGAEDILQDLQLERIEEKQAVQMMLPDSAEEAALVPHLARTPMHVDELSRLAGMPAAQVSSTLTMMELKGAVRQVGVMQYVALRESSVAYDVSE